jgi:hypothetical protein
MGNLVVGHSPSAQLFLHRVGNYEGNALRLLAVKFVG